MSRRNYCLVTPCRDEARYARTTLDAVTRQTEPPAAWVIVDDGSKDETPAILAEYAARFPYIRIVRRPDRGDRKLGGGVIDAFYEGYGTIVPRDFEYVCKFDLDLDLPTSYFAHLMDRMEAEPRIGTCSGKPYFYPPARAGSPTAFPLGETSGLVSEKCGDENSVGMSKFYRTSCFEQIGGFVRELMWDGIDCHRCRQLGWLAASWDDPDHPVRPPPTDGDEPQELVDRAGAARIRAVLHGDDACLHGRHRGLPNEPAAAPGRWAGHAAGLLQEHAPPGATLR